MASPALQATDYVVGRDPFKTPCTCGKSMYMLQEPYFHCPKCHDTYKHRGTQQPAICAHCGFRVDEWRKRNGLTQKLPIFP